MHDDFGIVPDPIFGEDGALIVEVKDYVSSEEARFNRTNLSRKDLQEAHEYLLEFSQAKSINARRAIVVAAVIAYSRPFKNSSGGQTGRATKKLVDFEHLLAPEELALHERVIELRDRAIAHSDYDFRPTGRVDRRTAPYSSGLMTWTRAFDVLEIEPDIERLTNLVKKLERHCMDELFRLNQQLSAQEAGKPPSADSET